MNKKIIIFITLFIIVLIPTYKVEAKTLGDLRKELSNLEAKYEENKIFLQLTDELIASLTSEINVITGKVNSIKSDIKKTEDDINTNQKKIEEKKKVNRPLVYAILGVTLLVLAVSGSAYAFFTAQATSDQFSGNTIDVQIKKPVVTLVVGDKTKGLIPIHDGSVTGHTTNQLTTAVSGTN